MTVSQKLAKLFGEFTKQVVTVSAVDSYINIFFNSPFMKSKTLEDNRVECNLNLN